MDVHVPLPITEGLRRRGVDVLTAQEDGTAELEDSVLLDRATALGSVFFTRDEDLLQIVSQRRHKNLPFATVVYAHQLEITIGQRIAELEIVAKAAFAEEAQNQIIYLPL